MGVRLKTSKGTLYPCRTIPVILCLTLEFQVPFALSMLLTTSLTLLFLQCNGCGVDIVEIQLLHSMNSTLFNN